MFTHGGRQICQARRREGWEGQEDVGGDVYKVNGDHGTLLSKLMAEEKKTLSSKLKNRPDI